MIVTLIKFRASDPNGSYHILPLSVAVSVTFPTNTY